ncbi:MAG: hypothetical protein IT204_00470 [Fimbriimonadaceae bacterium]|nr:hypothetical protein [Fimbriimonadaceae bacterium]
MGGVRYRIVTELPAAVTRPEFCDLTDQQVRIRVEVQEQAVVVIAHGSDPRRCEALLRQLGATEMGIDLCG